MKEMSALINGDARDGPVLVGVYDGGFNGIDTYAVQVALAGAAAGRSVTLLVSTANLAQSVRARLAHTSIQVLDLGLAPLSAREALRYRLWPGLAMHRLARGVMTALSSNDTTYPVVHLNHPGLAKVMHPFASRVYAAAWFYPHALLDRVVETWRHTAGQLPRRVVLATKSISHYLNDASGYGYTTCVVTPTHLLAKQLGDRGIRAVVCPPPVSMFENGISQSRTSISSDAAASHDDCARLVICCGDLDHPRKNVRAALRAVRLLGQSGRHVAAELIGRNSAALVDEMERMPERVFVSCPGPLGPDDVHARMRGADALLVPSLFEEWGYVAVESLLCGTPVVTFPVYPFADMLTEAFGVRARAMTDRAYADAILQVLARGKPAGLTAAANEQFGTSAVGHRLSEIWAHA
jgi:glycosyltransferase involved in cell wall biosynthesis